jgi:hypothetical protein
MRSNALAAVEDFDRARRDARPNLLAQQLVRHRVLMLVDLDVVVEPGPAFLPLAKVSGSTGSDLRAERASVRDRRNATTRYY